MEPMYYIGLDVHERKISYCVKDSGGKVYSEGSLSATRLDLDAPISAFNRFFLEPRFWPTPAFPAHRDLAKRGVAARNGR